VFPKDLKLSFEVGECKPLLHGHDGAAFRRNGSRHLATKAGAYTRPLFSST